MKKVLNRAKVEIVLSKLFVFYFLCLCLLYPYGIKFGAASIRISDIIALIIIAGGIFLILMDFKVNKKILFFIPLFPFLFLELFSPVLGSAFYGYSSSIGNTLRMALLYLPILMYLSVIKHTDLNKVQETFFKTLCWLVPLNFVYSVVQLMIVNNFLPQSLLLTKYFESFIVEEHFAFTDGMRASGFFVNSTALALFGIVAFIFFSFNYLSKRKKIYMLFTILSLALVILSSSRVAYGVAGILILTILIAAPVKKKLVISLVMISSLIGVFIVMKNTISIDEFFSRFTRLQDGLTNDYSFGYRLDIVWPSVINGLSKFPLGTLTQPTNIFELIDSGFLTYYAQGKWMFMICMAIMVGYYFFYAVIDFLKTKSSHSLVLIGLTIYLVISMIVSNPLRSPVYIYVYIFSIALLTYERRYSS